MQLLFESSEDGLRRCKVGIVVKKIISKKIKLPLLGWYTSHLLLQFRETISFLIIVFLCPQAIIEVRNEEISILNN